MIFLNVLEPCVKTCLTPWHLGGFGDFCKKTAVFGCLTNVLASPPIALESCSMAQRIGQSSRLHSKKNFAWGVQVFCEWRHKWRTFRPLWPTLPGPERQPLVFH